MYFYKSFTDNLVLTTFLTFTLLSCTFPLFSANSINKSSASDEIQQVRHDTLLLAVEYLIDKDIDLNSTAIHEKSSNKTSKILSGPQRPNHNNNHQRPINNNNYGGDLTIQGSGQPQTIQNHPQISDIDMQLLNAMEKLVSKMEKLEARVKTLESIVYYLTNKEKEKPQVEQGSCPINFSKVEGIKGKCYHVSSLKSGGTPTNIYDWKTAASECSKLGGRLVEMLSYSDFHRLVTFISKFTNTRNAVATDFWTGGLNPGLIWIWSESGQQIDLDKRFWNENDNSSNAPGCLKLSYSARLQSYFFKSAPCQQTQNYVCEVLDNTVSRALAHFEKELVFGEES